MGWKSSGQYGSWSEELQHDVLVVSRNIRVETAFCTHLASWFAGNRHYSL